jgi:hypothetical protein
MTVFGIAVLAVTWPAAADAQCIKFSRKLPCTQMKGPFAGPPRGVPQPQPPTSQALDCAMIMPADRNFRSAMPVIKPDPKVRHAMRIIPGASCKP